MVFSGRVDFTFTLLNQNSFWLVERFPAWKRNTCDITRTFWPQFNNIISFDGKSENFGISIYSNNNHVQ